MLDNETKKTYDVTKKHFRLLINSMDKYFINPYDYSYDEVCKLIGIDERYSIISESREGKICLGK